MEYDVVYLRHRTRSRSAMRNRSLWKKYEFERLIGNLRNVVDVNDVVDVDDDNNDDNDNDHVVDAIREDKFALNSMATWYDDFRSRWNGLWSCHVTNYKWT